MVQPEDEELSLVSYEVMPTQPIRCFRNPRGTNVLLATEMRRTAGVALILNGPPTAFVFPGGKKELAFSFLSQNKKYWLLATDVEKLIT